MLSKIHSVGAKCSHFRNLHQKTMQNMFWLKYFFQSTKYYPTSWAGKRDWGICKLQNMDGGAHLARICKCSVGAARFHFHDDCYVSAATSTRWGCLKKKLNLHQIGFRNQNWKSVDKFPSWVQIFFQKFFTKFWERSRRIDEQTNKRTNKRTNKICKFCSVCRA